MGRVVGAALCVSITSFWVKKFSSRSTKSLFFWESINDFWTAFNKVFGRAVKAAFFVSWEYFWGNQTFWKFCILRGFGACSANNFRIFWKLCMFINATFYVFKTTCWREEMSRELIKKLFLVFEYWFLSSRQKVSSRFAKFASQVSEENFWANTTFCSF